LSIVRIPSFRLDSEDQCYIEYIFHHKFFCDFHICSKYSCDIKIKHRQPIKWETRPNWGKRYQSSFLDWFFEIIVIFRFYHISRYFMANVHFTRISQKALSSYFSNLSFIPTLTFQAAKIYCLKLMRPSKQQPKMQTLWCPLMHVTLFGPLKRLRLLQ